MGDLVNVKADLIRELRIRRGWTASDLGRECGFSQGTRTRLGQGGPVSLRTVRRVAQALGVKVADLIASTLPAQAGARAVAS